jgi:hypothetical protein
MRSVLKFVAGVAALSAFSGAAFAAGGIPSVPEPGTIALVGVAVAALVAVSRKGKK